MKIGLIGIVGEQLKEAPWATLEAVAQTGYDGMEGAAGVAAREGISLGALRGRLDELRLEPVAQGGIRFLAEDHGVDAAIETAAELGCSYVVHYWGPCEQKDEVLEMAEFLDEAGARCRKAGLRLLYHNHNHEFVRFDGETGIGLLMENSDPENLGLELDVAWATYGGEDPAELVRRYAGRCPVLHMKDLVTFPEGGNVSNDGRKGTQFTEVGTGVVDVAGVVDAARETNVEWLVVEQDRPRELGPMESMRASYENLASHVRE
jgi:sugar phosphate isomerase/epimerase